MQLCVSFTYLSNTSCSHSCTYWNRRYLHSIIQAKFQQINSTTESESRQMVANRCCQMLHSIMNHTVCACTITEYSLVHETRQTGLQKVVLVPPFELGWKVILKKARPRGPLQVTITYEISKSENFSWDFIYMIYEYAIHISLGLRGFQTPKISPEDFDWDLSKGCRFQASGRSLGHV